MEAQVETRTEKKSILSQLADLAKQGNWVSATVVQHVQDHEITTTIVPFVEESNESES